MAKYRIYVWDMITIERSRTINIEAADEVEACEKAVQQANNGAIESAEGPWDEVEIDNTPYDAEPADVAQESRGR